MNAPRLLGRRGLVLALALALAFFLNAGSVLGAGPGIEAIREQMDQGQMLFLAGKYAEAAGVFEAGYQAHPYSAFLFNAGVCHQKLGHTDEALSNFRAYLQKDPGAPDAPQVKERIAKLEAQKAATPVASPDQPPVAAAVVPDDTNAKMKSLVVVETDPAGAPIRVYQRVDPQAAPFLQTGSNSGWTLVADRVSPTDFTLDVGRYHIVIEKFREFNRSETDIDVSPGHVHQFKANLSQGAFMSFLRVHSNVPGAYIFLDDDGSKKVAWGRAPFGQLVPPGPHKLLVEAPGFEPRVSDVELVAGDQKELEIELVRVGIGIVRLDANVPEVTVFRGEEVAGSWQRGKPALELELPAGPQELRIVADGYKDLRTTIDVPRGQILPMRADMVQTYPRATAWTQAILAVGLIGASTYFAVESNRLDSELQADRAAGVLTASDPRLDQGMWYSIGADTGFVLGGVLGGLSIFNFVRDPYPDSSIRRGKRQEFKDERAAPPQAQKATVPAAEAPR